MVKATQSGNFKAVALPQPSTVVARCYSLVDIGTIPNTYEGKTDGKVHKIYVTWEMPTLMAVFNEDKGEEPFVIGMELTLSTNEQSNLSKLVAQWRNKPLTPAEQKEFDVNKMVGKTCMISFIHKTKKNFLGQELDEITNENTVLKFNGIMPKPQELPCKDMLNPEMIWDWAENEATFDAEKFMRIPKWMRSKMKDSDEFKKFGYDPEEGQQAGTGTAAPQAEKDEPVDSDGW